MKNKKVLFLFVAVIVLCLSTALFAACNKNDTQPPSGSSFKEGDVIVDKDENTVTEKEYDEAGREVREISHVETLYNVTYLANDASVIYLKGNKSDEMYVSGYDGVPKTLSVKDLESKISLEGNPIVVKGITEEAFNGCETLTSVDLEKENTNALTFAIGDQAFANCPNLATVTLPTKVYMKSGSIGDGAFNNCESLTKVVIPDRFKTLGAYAFANCLKLETVTFNEGVAKVPQGFLYGCESLTSVTIPSTVNYVGNEAFSGCKKLTTITFPDSVTYVGEEALANCISLQSVKIPFIGNSYSPMSNSTFGNLFGTEDVVNPDTEESYLYEAHNHFIPKTLTTVEVTNATSLPAYAFAGLESLTSLRVTYTTADRIRVYAADTNYYNYDVPQITAVGAYAFAGLKNIENFPIPEKATAIGEAAFAATGLTDASLAAILMDAKTIGAGAFSSLEKVENVSIPQNVLSVDRYAFSRNANLTSFLAGAKTALSSGILAECRSLETVTVPYIGTASVYYEDIDSEPEIVVNDTPFATLFSTSVPSDLYDEDEFSLEENYYQEYGKYYVPNTLNTITVTSATAIPTNAFREILARNISISLDSDMLSDFDFDGVTIEPSAFNGCKNLTYFALDNNYKEISSSAFKSSGLTSVTIPSSVRRIAENAFANCEKLTTFTVNGKNTAIYNAVLANCRSLSSVTVPYIGTAYWTTDTYTDDEHLSYANNAFANLFSYNYPSDMYSEDDTFRDSPRYYGVDTRGSGTYYVPTSLTTVDVTNAQAIPYSAFNGILASNITVNYDEDATNSERTGIGAYAFNGCENLTSFTIDSQIETIGSYAFASTGITSVTVPQNVNSISNNAFANCEYLTTFTINGKDVALSNSVLANCRSLESVTVPYIGTAALATDYYGDEYLSYANNAFATIFSSNRPSDMYADSDINETSPRYYSTTSGYYVPVALDTIVITNAVAIPNYAFRGILASSITVTYDEDATNSERTSIGTYAFYGCENLTSFTIDSQITSINNYAFANSGLTSITIPESVTYVSSNAFENCEDLTSLVWNAAQSSVPDFSKSNITTLTLGEEVVDIPSNAFRNMTSLTTINVNATALNSIGSGAFSGTPWLNDQTGAVYLGRVLFTYNGTIDNAIFQVSSNTVAIESYALQNQSNVEAVYIPTAVTRIGEYAFNGCERLNVVLYSGTQDQYGNISKSYAGLSGKNVIYSASTRERTYTFSSDGETIDPQTAIYLSVLPIPAERVGYVFYGWYEDAEFSGDPISTPYFTTNRTGTTLYAKWITEEEFNGLSDYSFYFYSQGSRIATVTDKFLQEFPTEPIRNGYTFAGWYDNSNFDGSPVSLPYHAQSNTTLYAKWVRNNVLDGTSFDTAYVAVVGQTYDVITTTENPRVYFRFVPTASGSYSITASNNSGDNYGHLYNSSKAELAHDDDGAGNNNNFKITWSLNAGQTYYIAARMLSNGTGNFQITITMN